MRFGYTDPPADRAYGFTSDTGYQTWATTNLKREEFKAQLAAGQPALVNFWYRQSPQVLATYIGGQGLIAVDDPPATTPGMVEIDLDPQGRLVLFHAMPPRIDSGVTSRSIDWDTLLEAAGLDSARFKPAEPQQVPPVGFDARMAWTGSFAHAPSVPLRIEAAAWKGRPVWFEIAGPWPPQVQHIQMFPRLQNPRAGAIGVFITGSVVAIMLAWSNYRRNRADLGGSWRLAIFAFGCSMAQWILTTHHVSAIDELGYMIDAIAWALLAAALFWVLYIALEPYVRRRWPQSLISWTRVLTGNVRNPLVGGHVLLGTTVGVEVSLSFLFIVRALILAQFGVGGPPPVQLSLLNALLGTTHAAGEWITIDS